MVDDERREEYRRQLTKSFRHYARFYDAIEWVVPLVRLNPRRLVAEAVPQTVTMILDACTGNGAVLAAVAASHPSAAVYGLDLSPDMMALAKRRIAKLNLANAQILPGDCTKMPFPDGTFDAVTTSYGLHEMPSDIRAEALGEAMRVLKPGGLFVAIDWDEPHRLIERVIAPLRSTVEPDYIKELFGEGMARQIAAAGFVDLNARHDIILSQLVTAKKP